MFLIPPDFLYTDTVVVKPFIRFGSKGEEFETAYSLPCVFENSTKRVSRQGNQNSSVQEVVANARMFCPAGTRIPESSTVTYEGREYRVIQCTPMKALSESYVEVLLL